MSDETKNRSYLHQGEKAAGELVVSGGDAPKVEELAEEVLHFAPPTVEVTQTASFDAAVFGEEMEVLTPSAASNARTSHSLARAVFFVRRRRVDVRECSCGRRTDAAPAVPRPAARSPTEYAKGLLSSGVAPLAEVSAPSLTPRPE